MFNVESYLTNLLGLPVGLLILLIYLFKSANDVF